jgi:hypothetical protein
MGEPNNKNDAARMQPQPFRRSHHDRNITETNIGGSDADMGMGTRQQQACAMHAQQQGQQQQQQHRKFATTHDNRAEWLGRRDSLGATLFHSRDTKVVSRPWTRERVEGSGLIAHGRWQLFK